MARIKNVSLIALLVIAAGCSSLSAPSPSASPSYRSGDCARAGGWWIATTQDCVYPEAK